jgi:hypothetical protein
MLSSRVSNYCKEWGQHHYFINLIKAMYQYEVYSIWNIWGCAILAHITSTHMSNRTGNRPQHQTHTIATTATEVFVPSIHNLLCQQTTYQCLVFAFTIKITFHYSCCSMVQDMKTENCYQQHHPHRLLRMSCPSTIQPRQAKTKCPYFVSVGTEYSVYCQNKWLCLSGNYVEKRRVSVIPFCFGYLPLK